MCCIKIRRRKGGGEKWGRKRKKDEGKGDEDSMERLKGIERGNSGDVPLHVIASLLFKKQLFTTWIITCTTKCVSHLRLNKEPHISLKYEKSRKGGGEIRQDEGKVEGKEGRGGKREEEERGVEKKKL